MRRHFMDMIAKIPVRWMRLIRDDSEYLPGYMSGSD
jgi:hypothetical protein